MNLFKKIKHFFHKPFNHNPEDFRLKLEESYGGGMVYFKYSANGGKDWSYVHWSRKPFLGHMDYNWEWERVSYLSYNLKDGSFAHELDKFSSYQKILDYEKGQREEMEKGDKEHRAWRENYYKQKRETLDKINQKLNK